MTSIINSTVTVGLIQAACETSPEANLKKTEERIAESARAGAQIVCTQELFLTQYFCQSEDAANFRFAEPIPGPTTERLTELARLHGVVVIASLFEKRTPGLYHNTAAIIDADGTLLGIYRKMHIPDDPLYYEKFYFTPGDLGFRAWTTQYGRIGVLICWDQWYPEAARLTALNGAEILFYPTAIGWHPIEKDSEGSRQYRSWELIQRSHAVANGCFVAAPNRIGHEKPVGGEGIEFWGQSFIAAPTGEIVAQAGQEREQLLIATLDRDAIEQARTGWPFLRDRRVDAYSGLTQRFLD